MATKGTSVNTLDVANRLHWVREEIDRSLQRVRAQLEHYLESQAPDEQQPLLDALDDLRQVRGTFTVCGYYGAATLAAEMMRVFDALIKGEVENRVAAYGALSSASLQLCDYTDLLAAGEPDRLIVLQPVVNELRLADCQPLVTESELFAIQATLQNIDIQPPSEPRGESQAVARDLLDCFQMHFLQWYRGQNCAAAMATLNSAAEKVAGAVCLSSLRSHWWTLTLLTESMPPTPCDSMDLKRLLGRSGMVLRVLADHGEAAAAAQLGTLPGQLAYYLSLVQQPSPRAEILIADHGMRELVLGASDLEDARRRLHLPNASVLDQVHREIRQDLQVVKDALDLIVRTEGRSNTDLDLQRRRLMRLSETLGLLGLGFQQRVLANQARAIAGLSPDSPAWLEMATALLHVEYSLEEALFRAQSQFGIRSEVEGDPISPDFVEDVASPTRQDLNESVAALLRESLIDFAQIRTAISECVGGQEFAGLTGVSRRLDEVAAGLEIIDHNVIARLIRSLAESTKGEMLATLCRDSASMDCLADAVSCAELYLELLRDGVPRPEGQLEKLAGFAERLHDLAVAHSASMRLEPTEPLSGDTQPAPRLDYAEGKSEVKSTATAEHAQSRVADEVDEDILAIFIQEAEEVVSGLRRDLSRLRKVPQDRDLLLAVRRAFHTLKGSSRMVSADSISALAFAVEQVFNRCLDGTLSVQSAVLDVADESAVRLDALVSNLRGMEGTTANVDDLIKRADSVRALIDTNRADIYGVFRDDARERLGLVDRWLEMVASQADAAVVESDVVRAFHTLGGSAGIIGNDAIQRVAQATESYLQMLQADGAQIPTEMLTLLRDIVDSLQRAIAEAGIEGITAQQVEKWLLKLPSGFPEPSVASYAVAPNEAPAASNQLEAEASLEILDLVKSIQASVIAWNQSMPERDGRAVATQLNHLAERSKAGGYEALVDVATALSGRLADLAHAPSQAMSAALSDVFEGIYGLLDCYHEGREPEEPAPLLDQIAGLPVVPGRRERGSQTTTELPPGLPLSPSQFPERDTELVGIFLEEARELVVDFTESLTRLSSDDPSGAAEVLVRVLHTFKGSARMAGFEEIGLLCERHEQQVTELLDDDPRKVVSLLPSLKEVKEQLEQFVQHETGTGREMPVMEKDYLWRKQVNRETLLNPVENLEQGMDDAASRISGYTPATADGENEPSENVPPDIAATRPNAESAPVVPEPDRRAPYVASNLDVDSLSADLDPELVTLFSAEAGELLDQLDASLEHLKSEQYPGALQDMLRALHTLKGAARSAGLPKMADTSHELESIISSMQDVEAVTDDSVSAQLQLEVDRLHQHHDALCRWVSSKSAYSAAPEPEVEGVSTAWSGDLFWEPPEEQADDSMARREHARVSVDVLNAMLNQMGEVSICRSRLEQINSGLRGQLLEISQTVERIRGQLRMLDIETEAQISARGLAPAGGAASPYDREFDPLEMDRYTRMQELSRALAEAVGDMASINVLLDQEVNESETLLQQQGLIGAEVQRALMSTLMIPFSRHQSRFERVIRQTSLEAGKRVELNFEGTSNELDRNVLERITAPIEHLLRNSVIHGVETPEIRLQKGKSESGRIDIRISREADELVIDVGDDGTGLDFASIREKAVKQGLLDASADLSGDDLARLIFEPGFSTAPTLTQAAGRGLGLDIVSATVRQLGGMLELRSQPGRGSRFLIRLPVTMAVSQTLLVRLADEYYALPLSTVIGITRIPSADLLQRLAGDLAVAYGGEEYPAQYLGDYLGLPRPTAIEARSGVVIIARAGETLLGEPRRVALVVDELLGNRELIAKPIGPQLSLITGISGASILADGRVVLLLDIPSLVTERGRRERMVLAGQVAVARDTVMVVDDSITMRRVAQRVLERAGLRVIAARDGLDAIAMLQAETPSVILLDIEMPRADGFEVAEFVRNNERLSSVPIIMITSRSGEKHRARARDLGIMRYLIKPYQEDQLISEVEAVREAQRA